MSRDQGKASSMKVEIQCKKWIKPATPTPFHLQKLKLSPIDQIIPSYLVQPIFYYDIARETTTDQVQNTTPGWLQLQLEESLSKVLTLYYPFAGRIIYDEDGSLFSCQDQGVGFVVAKVNRKLDEYLADGEYDSKVLFSDLESPGTSNPLVVVQVNMFTCGGLAIGLSVNHKLGDMFTISTFMNAWATTCHLGTLDKVVRPSFSFSSLLPPSDFPSLNLSNPDEPPPPDINTATSPPRKNVMKRYLFTGEAITKIRSSICGIELNYTRVELVIALIARNLIKLARAKPLLIFQPMNFRSRTGLPIDENSCGNLFVPVIVTFGELDSNGLQWELPELAKLVKKSIKNVASEMSKVRGWSELSEKAIKANMDTLKEIKKAETAYVIAFSSWCRFPLYEVDFGWGRPTLVSIAQTRPINSVVLMDCKSDVGGIEALVCFNEQDMASFEPQADMLQHASFF